MVSAFGSAEVHAGAVDPDRTERRPRPSRAVSVQAGLARLIETEILPRLAQTLPRPPERTDPPPPVSPPSPGQVVVFANALMARESDEEQVQALASAELPLDILLLDLLAPAALHLGRLWEEDEADFVDVTVGLGRLLGLARMLCDRLEAADVAPAGHRVLLMPCPGETHLFSLSLVASFFREAGWDAVVSRGDDDPVALVRDERFDVIGVSLSCDVLLPRMADLIAGLRAASSNPGVRVLVGGPPFLRDPACAAVVGADAAAEDGRAAVRVAETLIRTG